MTKSLVNWLTIAFAVPFAAFEAISIHSVFALGVSRGAVAGLLVTGAAMAATVFLLVGKNDRHRIVSRTAIVVSVLAVLSGLALAGQFAAARGVSPPGGSTANTVLLMLFQTGWAFTYWLIAEKGRRDQARYIPAAIGTVALLLGGLLIGGVISGKKPARAQVASEQYVTLPRPENYAFARETDRAGNVKKGSEFAHYHTGQLPLLGINFSTRDWMRRARIADDFRGIFDRDATTEGRHVLLAKPGFALSAVELRADDHVNALRVQFAAFDGTQLDLTNSYWSDWAGSYELGERSAVLESYYKPVVGLVGSKGLTLNSLSLLVSIN